MYILPHSCLPRNLSWGRIAVTMKIAERDGDKDGKDVC